MSKKLRKDISKVSYQIIRKNQLLKTGEINEHVIGSRKTLYDSNNKPICSIVEQSLNGLGKLSDQQFSSFLGQFTKDLYRNFYNNPNLHDLEINFKGFTKKKNKVLYTSLKEGQSFYNIDLNSAFWQVLHNLGYINSKFFNKYQNLSEYKMAKRLCVSFLARKNKKTYCNLEESYVITCEIDVLERVYDNVRNYLHCLFVNMTLEMDFISYNIDSISVTPENLPKVKLILDNLNLQYKYTFCQKKTDKTYLFGKVLKIF